MDDNKDLALKRNLSLSIVILICIYLVASTSTNLIPSLLNYDSKRIMQSLLLISILTITWLYLRNNYLKTLQKVSLLSKGLMTLFLITGVISSLYSNNNYSAALEVSLISLLYLATFSIMMSYLQNPLRFTHVIATSLIILIFIQSTLVITSYTAAITSSPSWHPFDLFQHFDNIRFFNQIQSWTLALIVLPIIIYADSKRSYFFLITMACLWWLLFFASGSRGVMLSMAIATLTTYIVYRKHASLWIKLQILSFIGGLICYLILFIALPFYLHGNIAPDSILRNVSSPGRIYLWQRAWELLQNNFFLGIGPMNYACDANNSVGAHPHNSLIQIAVEWGVPIALATLFLFIYSVSSWIKKSLSTISLLHRTQVNIHISLFAALACGACHSLFSGIIVMPASQIFMILIIGWMLGIYYQNSKRVNRLMATGILLLGLTICSATIISIEVYQKVKVETYSFEINERYFPRFWLEGKTCNSI